MKLSRLALSGPYHGLDEIYVSVLTIGELRKGIEKRRAKATG
jgi:predicted nucleic acid-binding protein